ncbi:MAG: YceI family protein [Caulobacter sp.]|nr:YceI family protein [Caulobacter sp.]
MRRLFAAIALFLLTALPASAAPAPAWTVDKAASKIAFTSSFGGEAFSGGFRTWTADIRFDPANLAGSSITATIAMNSAFTGNADRDASLPDAKWFAVKAHPTAVFRSTSFKALGGNRYQANGTLTLRGVSKPLTLPFTLVITGDQAKMNARVSLNRLAFGVGQDEWKNTEVVPDAVAVTIAISARKAK